MGTKLMNQHMATSYADLLVSLGWRTLRRFMCDAATLALIAMAITGLVLLEVLGLPPVMSVLWLTVAFSLFMAMLLSFCIKLETREATIPVLIERRFRIRAFNA